jgi:hypothetical protein
VLRFLSGQKVLLAVKNMGGESEAAWRTRRVFSSTYATDADTLAFLLNGSWIGLPGSKFSFEFSASSQPQSETA